MAKFARFLKLYSTELITAGYGKVIADPVRIEFFRGARTYDVLQRTVPLVVPTGVEMTVAAQQSFEVPADHVYIELIARTTESLGQRQYCEDQIDRVVAQLSALLSPNLFCQEIWSGWLSDSEQLATDFWLMRSDPIELNLDDLQDQLGTFSKSLASDPDIEVRFALMSKLFSRAIAMPPGEERFLWLWTILEVFPMKDTTNIQPISEYLWRITGQPSSTVKEKLGIGKLFGARSSLVHDGRLPYTRPELGEVLKKLEAIDMTVIRSIGGMPYAHELEEFLS